MKPSPFKRKVPAPYVKPERIPPVYARLTVPVNMPMVSQEFTSIQKEPPARSEPYRRLVAMLPCARCMVTGRSQAAHADQGKGGHIKSDDRTCFPLCGDAPGIVGCHTLMGASGHYTREQRRNLEALYGIETRKIIRLSGHWPKSLPYFEEQLELEIAA